MRDHYFISVWRTAGDIPYAYGPSRPDLVGSGKEELVTRVALLVISIVAGAALAVVLALTVTSVLASSNESPVNQQLYNYGTR